MTEKKVTKEEARRKVIKSTLAGGAVLSASILPDRWDKPSLNSIVLPAHARTTNVFVNGV